jgi:lactoylglutathione lyase
MTSATFKRAVPYADDALNLPVADVDAAIPFYQQIFGFGVVSRNDSPFKSAILARDQIQIGLAENGGDPTQEGCYFEVDNVEAAYAELKNRGAQCLTLKSSKVASQPRKSSSSSRRTVSVT